MLKILKFQCGYKLFRTLYIVEDSDLAGMYVDSTPSWGYPCRNESVVSVISHNWEWETGLFVDYVRLALFRLFRNKNKLSKFSPDSQNYQIWLGARDITQLCFSSNFAGIVANKVKQSFNSVYSYYGIESIEHALRSMAFYPWTKVSISEFI